MHLLRHAPNADYYAFCDQDDIWFPDKLHKALECLEKLPNGKKLYCSNLLIYANGRNEGLLWDENLGMICIEGLYEA